MQQLHLEDQRRVRRDRPARRALSSISNVGVAGQFSLLSHLHRRDADVPRADHLASADDEVKPVLAVRFGDRGVEDRAVGQLAGVVGPDLGKE